MLDIKWKAVLKIVHLDEKIKYYFLSAIPKLAEGIIMQVTKF
jgi:hypothetical protein